MTAELPPGVSVMLVRYAIDRERDAKLFRGAGCVGHADECAREAKRARDIIAAHDEALAQRTDAGSPPDEARLRAMMRDPRYWRTRDPEFVREVQQGFSRLVSEARI